MLDLCLPPNCVKFVAKISGRLAITEQHLTLEFLSECFVGFEKATEDQRYLCLYYMTPWIPNLGRTSSGSPKEVSRTKEVLRMLIGISLQNVSSSSPAPEIKKWHSCFPAILRSIHQSKQSYGKR